MKWYVGKDERWPEYKLEEDKDGFELPDSFLRRYRRTLKAWEALQDELEELAKGNN